jgi:hypothetical protein
VTYKERWEKKEWGSEQNNRSISPIFFFVPPPLVPAPSRRFSEDLIAVYEWSNRIEKTDTMRALRELIIT